MSKARRLRRTAMRVDLAARYAIVHRLGKRVAAVIRGHGTIVVGVTGSIGKTTAAAAIAHVLSARMRVFAAPGANHGGRLPLGLLGVVAQPTWYRSWKAWRAVLAALRRARADYPYDVVVVEIAAARRGDIRRVVRFLQPDIAVVTAVAPAHMSWFHTIERVLDEKWALAEAAPGVAYNADDERLYQRGSLLPRERATGYGLTRGEIRFREVERLGGRLTGVLVTGSDEREVATRMVARQSLYALAAAAAVAGRFGMSADEVARALADFEPVPGRMNPLSGKNDSLILDDSNNASPQSVLAALHTLSEFAPRRRIALLGSMKEQGHATPDVHRQVGARVSRTADLLVTIGDEARRYLAEEAIRSGMERDAVRSFDTPYEAGAFVSQILEPDDVVLVKGSRGGIYAEEAVKALLADADAAPAVLVRQTPYWLRVKQESFPQVSTGSLG